MAYLTFASDGRSFISPRTNRYGKGISLANCIPTKYGYTCKGWFTDGTIMSVNVEILAMLTKGVSEKVEFQKLKYRPLPFDAKNIVRVMTICA